MPTTKSTCASPSGTIVPGEATIKTKRPPKFYDREPHLEHLDTSKLIVAAQYLLSGVNPPREEADYFSAWVHDQAFEHKPYEQRDMMALSLDRDGIPDEELEKPENQRKLLELAIRECLEGVRTLPSFRNLNLTNNILQMYRRELCWLLGRYIEVSA